MRKLEILPKFKLHVIILAVVFIAALAWALLGGVSLGIDFTGSTLITVDLGESFDPADIESVLSGMNTGDYSVSKTGNQQTSTTAAVKVSPADSDIGDILVSNLSQKFTGVQLLSVEQLGVSSNWKAQFTRAAIVAAVSILLITAYLWRRYSLIGGLVAVASGVLTALMTACCMVFFGRLVQFNSTFFASSPVIALMAVCNTVIFLGSVRDDSRVHSKKAPPVSDVAEKAAQASLSRIMHSAVAVFIIAVILFVMGGAALKEFALPVGIGALLGGYIPAFIAPALWSFWTGANARKKRR